MIFWTENPNHELLLIAKPFSNICWETSWFVVFIALSVFLVLEILAEQLFGLEPFVVVVVLYKRVELEVMVDELKFEEKPLI